MSRYSIGLWLPFVALIALSRGGCAGGESLTLSSSLADPTDGLQADGTTIVELTAEVIFRGSALKDGKRVFITANEPVLFDGREDAEGDAPGLRPAGEAEIRGTTRGGVARAYLLAPVQAATITVEASYITVNQDVLSDSVTFEVAPPPLISAGIRMATGVTPQFGILCDGSNVGAFLSGRDEIRVNCGGNIVLKDYSGRDLPHTLINFYTEAGIIEDTPATKSAPRQITYVVPITPVDLPKPVMPMAAETSAGLTEASANPRDGLVTLLAVVRGHEAFEDLNGNGRWDETEPFTDEGEPFLDVDDDGVYDSNIDGPHCCDSNHNGLADPANGRWDNDVWIGRMTHILWTGPLDDSPLRSRISPATVNIVAGSQTNLTLSVVDANFNPIAAWGSTDRIDFSKNTSKLDWLPTEPMVDLTDTHGMILNDRFPTFIFGRGDTVFKGFDTTGQFVRGREITFTVADGRASPTVATWFTVFADVRYTPGPGASLETPPSLTASGVLEQP